MQKELDFLLGTHRTDCIPLFLTPKLWFLTTLEIVLAFFGMIFNCAVTAAIYYAVPVSVIQRRSLGAMSANYAFVAGLHLARKCFFIFAIHYPCITIVTTINCKLQEFPLVFLYIMCMVLPTAVSLQSLFKHKKNTSAIEWANTCTIHQTSLIVFCLVLALLFTAFDDELQSRQLLQCSIVLAIQQKETAFWFISTLIVGHALALLFIQIGSMIYAKPITFQTFFNQNLRDFIVIQCVAWESTLLFTGTLALYEFVSLSSCETCLATALEVTFIIIPLCICCANPFLAIWIVFPIRNSAVRLCPKLKRVLPEYDLPTPPPVVTPDCPKMKVIIQDCS